MPDTVIRGAVLLLAANVDNLAGYRRAAEKLHVAHALGTADAINEAALHLRFEQRESALEIVQYSSDHPLAAIVAVDAAAAPSAMRAASMIGMRCHAPRAADACLEPFSLRQKLGNAGLRTPVLGDAPPGADLALAAIIEAGKMRVLGLLGAELSKPQQRTALEAVLRAARVIGLSHGPLSAHLRVAGTEVWVLDLAAVVTRDLRDQLRFRIPLVDEDVSLEEVVLRHALGLDIKRIYSAQR